METITLPVGQLQANCYLVYDKNTRETIIIDPGDEGTFIVDEILRLKLNPTAIVATHGHFDHILASWELQEAFSIPFYLHSKDRFLLDRMQSSASHWLGHKVIENPPMNVTYIDTVSLARPPLACLQGEALQIIETPGHTPGGICLVVPKEKVIFTGDTLFTDGMVGETSYTYSSKKDLQHSVDLIKKTYSGFLAYPGHGESFCL